MVERNGNSNRSVIPAPERNTNANGMPCKIDDNEMIGTEGDEKTVFHVPSVDDAALDRRGWEGEGVAYDINWQRYTYLRLGRQTKSDFEIGCTSGRDVYGGFRMLRQP